MDDLTVRLADGTSVVVAASLSTITTYVLLEQEAWFEKEARFVPLLLKRGMTATPAARSCVLTASMSYWHSRWCIPASRNASPCSAHQRPTVPSFSRGARPS